MLLSYHFGACPKEETMMLTFPTWVEEGDSKPWLRGDELSTQIGLSMMKVTKKWWKKPRAATQFWWVLMFSRIPIACNLQLDPFKIFYHMFIRYIISGAQLYQFVQLYQCGCQERVTYHANYAANMDKIAKLQKVKSLAFGPMGAVFCDVFCLLKTLKNPEKHTRMLTISNNWDGWL